MVMSLEDHWIFRLRVKGRKEGKGKMWRKQVEGESMWVGVIREDALC